MNNKNLSTNDVAHHITCDFRNRIEWLDMVRGIAILLVVLCHCTQGIYDMSINSIMSYTTSKQLFVFFLFSLGRLAVPFFLLMTGYFLLDKRYSNQDCENFWKKKWLPMFISTEFWFIVYDALLMTLGYEEFDLIEVVEDLLFLRAINMTHVWYLPMILGMYILIPFVANAISDFRPRELKFPTIAFSAFTFIFPIIQLIEICNGDCNLSLQFSLSFCGGAYGLYLVYGYFIKKDTLKALPSELLCAGIISGLSLCIILQYYSYHHNNKYDLWYNCAFLMVASLCAFELFSRVKHVPFVSFFQLLSRHSFSIYLVHNIFRSLMVAPINNLPADDFSKLIILFVLTLLTSSISIYLINKIPFIGKIVLYTH